MSSARLGAALYRVCTRSHIVTRNYYSTKVLPSVSVCSRRTFCSNFDDIPDGKVKIQTPPRRRKKPIETSASEQPASEQPADAGISAESDTDDAGISPALVSAATDAARSLGDDTGDTTDDLVSRLKLSSQQTEAMKSPLPSMSNLFTGMKIEEQRGGGGDTSDIFLEELQHSSAQPVMDEAEMEAMLSETGLSLSWLSDNSCRVEFPIDKYPDVNFIGLLIGKGGENAIRVREESGVKGYDIRGGGRASKFPSEEDDEPLHVTVTDSNPDKIKQAVRSISELVKERLRPRDSMDGFSSSFKPRTQRVKLDDDSDESLDNVFGNQSGDGFRKKPKPKSIEVMDTAKLYDGPALDVFTDNFIASRQLQVQETRTLFDILEQEQIDQYVNFPPENAFEEMAEWTREGKLWKYPIDNEQDLGAEADVGFDEHVFLARHLHGFPSLIPVKHFMELVVTGLSMNSYMTVDTKIGHIDWYRNYFQEKKAILDEYQNQAEQQKQALQA